MYNRRNYQWATVMVALLFCMTTACKETATPVVQSCTTVTDSLIPLKINIGKPLNLYLDSLLVIGVQTPVQYLEKENALLILDTYGKRLLQYPLTAADTVTKPSRTQALHLNDKVMYMHYLNRDSLLLYTYGLFRLSYYNLDTDTVYKTLSFYDRKVKTNFAFNPAPPNASNAAPIIFKGNNIIGTGYLMGEHDSEVPAGRTLFSILHLPDGSLQHKVPYSAIYKTGNWGGSHMRTTYSAYNRQQGTLLLSLPADHNLQVIDSAWNITTVYAGSRQKFCISSMPIRKNSPQLQDPDNALRYFTNTAAYRDIIYDAYHQRYYRVLQTPPAAAELNAQQLGEKHATLIAFDNTFHYLGEGPLPKGLALDNFFVTEQGLYFLNVANHDQNIGQYVHINPEL